MCKQRFENCGVLSVNFGPMHLKRRKKRNLGPIVPLRREMMRRLAPSKEVGEPAEQLLVRDSEPFLAFGADLKVAYETGFFSAVEFRRKFVADFLLLQNH